MTGVPRQRPSSPDRPERLRPSTPGPPELELTAEELRALADEGVDPDDARRLTSERPEDPEASDHDRDTAREDLEGLVPDPELEEDR